MEKFRRTLSGFSRAVVTSSLLLIVACSSNTSPQLPPATVHASLTENIDNYVYLIGPGDELSVFVWGNPEISGSFTVRPDGMISTSLVDDLEASGKTSTELAREFEAQLSEYIRDPIVSIIVNDFVGPFGEQVRVIGEASEPKAISYTENMTILDVMVQVGGLTEYADGNDVSLIRVIDGQYKKFNVKMDDLLKFGTIEENVDVLPGDIIIIPEAWF
ncbi:XrtA/PEP-CTERM system exopolysaccharide export protein [Vibrio algarum]|uniref:Polysaccharide export protein n=1 Tax=Vibrio algarum TaxID=3020714 RepID=A0ABT4YQ89_9VIBR|nr:XrtA/PEP-CTERM system exopolysaccharide export protein [Vibrio sp. KJ40-1]MDB1123728.1 polysaccharide export protein [Vibrio sp. KJ40-1]